MDSLGLYEDLPLFNGELMVGFAPLDDEGSPNLLLHDEEFKPFVEASIIPLSAKMALEDPQQGSGEHGLAELLGSSPQCDLPAHFQQNEAWMDCQVDLLDLLTDNNVPSHLEVLHIPTDMLPLSPGTAVVPSMSPTVESRDFVENDFLGDLFGTEQSQGDKPVTLTLEDIESFDTENIIADLVDSAGLQDLLADSSVIDDASTLDNVILSPVAEDSITSLLSQSLDSDVNVSRNDSSMHFTDEQYSNCSTSFSNESDDSDSLFPCEIRSKKQGRNVSPQKSRVSKMTDRKERKKQQNRSAALRYRQKKRSQQDIEESEYDVLEKKNKKLKENVDSLAREIKYLKDLMTEVYRAKSKAGQEKIRV